MYDVREPTQEEMDRVNSAIVEMLQVCAKHRLDLGGAIKATNAVVVKAFEYLEQQGMDDDALQASVRFYANIATATVNFLQDGTIPPDTDFGMDGIEEQETVQ